VAGRTVPTDPSRNTVVIHSHFIPLGGDLSSYNLYVRYDPSINGNGGGGAGNGGGDSGVVDTSTGHAVPVAFDTTTTSQAVNRTYATPVFSALDVSPVRVKVKVPVSPPVSAAVGSVATMLTCAASLS